MTMNTRFQFWPSHGRAISSISYVSGSISSSWIRRQCCRSPIRLLLGQHVDGAVFSILRDVSQLPRIHAAHGRMAALGVPILGAVFPERPSIHTTDTRNEI